MALIPVVGRRTASMRLLLASLYLALSLGAVTMVYPFLVMLSQSVKSQYDMTTYDVWPRYFASTPALFGKYAEDKYRADITAINDAYGTHFIKLQDAAPPRVLFPIAPGDWTAFARSLPARFGAVGFGGAPGSYTPSPLLDRYQTWLASRFHGDIHALDRAYAEEDDTFLTVFPPFEQPLKRSWLPGQTPKDRDWARFQQTLPPSFFTVAGADPLYRKWLKEEAYATLADLNRAWGTAYATYDPIILSPRPDGNGAGNPAQQRDWQTFVRAKLPFRDVVVSASALPAWRAFLRAHGDALADTALLPTPDAPPAAGKPLLDWLDFLATAAPASALSIDTPETRWRASHPAPSAAPMTAAAYQSDWQYAQTHAAALRLAYIGRNYRLVLQYIALHGNGIWVTIAYCLLAVLTALIVNPLCAYALSRYSLSYGNAVLLFLLATMAFPAEVTMIPGFLLLKQLGLLNTFAALVLPGAASGFSIFLLKGFFDSLPRELYEAGTLDGASEARLFFLITLPLSRPIFAVIALQAFAGAYGAFLFALLYCQNRSMWTLMVWLYELQSSGAPQYVMMAALTLAAVPTLLVFLLAQNTIMKGIILPSYK